MKLLSFLLAMAMSFAVHAWPTRDITIIVPYGPGGSVDGLARASAPDLQQRLGVNVVVQNMPGAFNQIAMNHVIKNINDNHTFILSVDDVIAGAAPGPQRNNSYLEFTPVTVIGYAPFVLVGAPANTVDSLRQQVRSNQTINVGTVSTASGSWLAQLQPKIINPVQYKGTAQQFTDLAGNNIAYNVGSIVAWEPFIQGGMINLVAVGSTQRLAKYANVPTFQEVGFKGTASGQWWAVFARKDTDPDAISKFSQAMRAVVASNDRIKKIAEPGMDLINLDLTQSRRFVTTEIDKLRGN